MKKCFFAFSAFALATLFSAAASAHLRVTSPTPRWSGEPKPSPCGGADDMYPDRGPRHTFQAGETIDVEWNEYINHPGFYRISFSIDGDEFTNPVDQSDKTMYPGVLLQDIPDKTGGNYMQSVTLPNVNCDNCTLQVIQVMTEPLKAPTASKPTNHLYFNCIDLKLEGGPDGGGGAGGAGDDPGPGDSTGGAMGTGGNSGVGGNMASGGTSSGAGAGPGAGGGTTTSPTAESDGGCSIVTKSAGSNAVTLTLLGLALSLLRRRRQFIEVRYGKASSAAGLKSCPF